MEIYLVQHGESKQEEENPERPLTDRGKEEVELMARYVANMGVDVAQILHSDKLRAKQTAELLARYLTPPRKNVQQKGLKFSDAPYKAKKLVLQAEEPLMIVGHLPHLSKLASILILGKPDKEVIKFSMGGVICLTKNNEDWIIKWVLRPEIIR